MPTDPRSHRRYKTLRIKYLAAHGTHHPCCLCGRIVDLSLPGGSTWGPTIEHHTKVDHMRRIAANEAQLLDMVCDTSQWGIAHKQCQSKQGANHVNAKRRPPPSRW